MINKQILFTLMLCLLCHWVPQVSSHGRLWDPISRSSAWRKGFGTPTNYQDNELYCGGFHHQSSLGYKCGVCGDPYDQNPRENEAGGKYATGTITRTYTQGERVTIQVDLTAYHQGYFEFKICPTNDPKVRETQECFDLYPLTLAYVPSTRYYPDRTRMFNIDVVLPSDLTCTFCVLQWRYHVGNSWGSDANGTNCVGCGLQEEFYGCADIRIQPANGTLPETATDANLTPGTDGNIKQNNGGTPSLEEGSPTESSNEDQSSNGSNANGNNACRGTVAEYDSWCQVNCPKGFCPATHCTCPDTNGSSTEKQPGCRGTGSYASVIGMDEWCIQNCAVGHCPSSHCVCSK